MKTWFRKHPLMGHKNFPPFGDADKDGVKNWMDCQPLNPKKQDEVLHIQDSIVKSTPQRRIDFHRNPPEELGESDIGIYREGVKWREMKE